jgi:hypothetical protein
MPRQRGCAGFVRWELCCGLNFWFFWFKPKERRRKRSDYPDLSQLQHSLFLATDLFSIDLKTAKNQNHFSHPYPWVKTRGYQSAVPLGHFSAKSISI